MSGTQGVTSIKALLMALLLFACSVTLYINVSDIRISRGQTLNSRFRNIFSSMRRHVPSPGQKLEQIPRNVEASREISGSSASALRTASGVFAEAIRHIPEKVRDLGKMLKTAEEEFIQRELKSKGQTSLIGLPAPTVKAASKDENSKGQSAAASNPEPIDKLETAEAGNASDDDIDGEARKGNEQQGNQQKVDSQQVQSDMKKNVKDMFGKGGVEDGDSKWEPSNRRVDGRRGDSSHLCKNVTGSEDGEWVDIGDGTMQYRMKDCTLKRFTRSEARQCLSNRHVLQIGDSLTRYQFLGFISMLHHDWVDGSGTKPGFHPCKEAWGQGGWKNFYHKSSELFNGTESCDCYRNDGPMSIRTQQSLHENRYWRDASLNISISYMQLFGEINMRGHYPGPCYGRQDQECGPQSMTKENWARAGHVLTEPEYEKLKEAKFDWTGDSIWVMQNIVPHMKADTVLVNTGLWTEMTDPDKTQELYKLCNAAIVPHRRGEGKCFWKRTTTKLICHKTGSKRCNPTDKKELKPYPDTVPIQYAAHNNWGIYDVATPTMILPWAHWSDEVHFKPFVYNEMNNLLLNIICSSWV